MFKNTEEENAMAWLLLVLRVLKVVVEQVDVAQKQPPNVGSLDPVDLVSNLIRPFEQG